MNTIKVSNKGIEVKVSVFVYLDTDYPKEGMFIAYCPSLNLIGYGMGEENAKKDFEWIMDDYLSDMMSQGTLEEDLRNHGWKMTKKAFSEPKISDMMANNKELKDFIDKGLYQRINIDRTCMAIA